MSYYMITAWAMIALFIVMIIVITIMVKSIGDEIDELNK